MLLLPQTPWITLNGDYADSQIIIGSSRGHFQTVQKLRTTNYFCYINFSSESIPEAETFRLYLRYTGV